MDFIRVSGALREAFRPQPALGPEFSTFIAFL